MGEIIRKEFIKRYGERPNSKFETGLYWDGDIVSFTRGWNACEEWQAEQDAMSKDYQEEKQEEERLSGGIG